MAAWFPVEFANYKTAWQLAQDNNQPAVLRDHYRAEADRFAETLRALFVSAGIVHYDKTKVRQVR